MDSESRDEPTVSQASLALDIDVRCYDVILAALSESRRDDATLAAFLRSAYGAGYLAALTEPVRGELCRTHGFNVPKRQRR